MGVDEVSGGLSWSVNRNMAFEQGPEDREYICKKWGMEEILVNNDHYCSKFLWLTPGFQCSLHYHSVKHETFIALDGIIHVEYYPEPTKRVITALYGYRRDTLSIPPNTPHRFWSKEAPGGLLLEVSTTHSDIDVTRLEESREINPTHEIGGLS